MYSFGTSRIINFGILLYVFYIPKIYSEKIIQFCENVINQKKKEKKSDGVLPNTGLWSGLDACLLDE